MNRSGSGLFRGCLLLVAGLPCLAFAAEPREDQPNSVQYGVSVGATHSDNVTRVSNDEETETTADLGLNVDLRHDRRRKFADLSVDLQYRTNRESASGDTLEGGATIHAGYRLLRDRLTWVLDNNFGQSLIESRATSTPDNTQNLNILSTGPDILLPLGARTAINLQGRWTDVHYQTSEFGSRRLSGVVGVVRQLGPRSNVSLNGAIESTEYKDLPVESDYEVQSAYLSWRGAGSRTTLDLSVGYSALDEGDDSHGTATFAFGLDRDLASRSSVSIQAGRGLGDSADALRREQEIGGVSAGDRPASAAADPQVSDYASVAWRIAGSRSGLTLSGNWRREAHERDAALDRRFLSGRVQMTRRISDRLSVNFQSGYSTEDFSGSSITFDELELGLGADWRIMPAVGISASWDHLVGSGDTILGPGTGDFVENRVTLRLNWSPRR